MTTGGILISVYEITQSINQTAHTIARQLIKLRINITLTQASGRLSKIFTATMYSKRYDDANEAVHKMLQYFQASLASSLV